MMGTRIAPVDATDSVQYVVQLHLAGLSCVPFSARPTMLPANYIAS